MAYGSLPIWKEAPFLRYLLAFCAGIYCGAEISGALPEWIIYAGILPVASFLVSYEFFPIKFQYKLRYWTAPFIFILFFLSGLFIFQDKLASSDPNWLGHLRPEQGQLIVYLNEPLQEKARTWKALATADAFATQNAVKPASGKIILYFRKDSLPPTLNYGDRLLIRKDFEKIRSAGNPGSFDYAEYCRKQGIYHQVFLRPSDYRIIDSSGRKILRTLLFSSREKLLQILRKYIPGEKEQGLAEALLIGYKDNLDSELLQSYSNTGVVHVIAISGLHLGLIYMLLGAICKILPMKNAIFQGLIIIAGLWIFSALAGASPSVLRSATMFSFMVIGGWMQRKAPSVNSLAASAFLLLCVEPYWLWDTGFQLSYSAVLGLMILATPVYRVFYLKNPLLDNLWKTSSVTIAATILTFPLTIFYFHQFPTYFIITNLLVIPLSSLILLMELLLCSLSYVPIFANFIGHITGLMIGWMNDFVAYSETIPGASFQGMKIDIVQVILLYAALTLFYQFYQNRRPFFLRLALVTLIFFAAYRSIDFYFAGRQQLLIVYNINRQTAIDLIHGQTSLFMASGELQNDVSAKNYSVKPARIRYRIVAEKFAELKEHTVTRVALHDEQITIFHGLRSPPEEAIPTDILIIAKTSAWPPDNFLKQSRPKMLVMDGSNAKAIIEKWSFAAETHGIPVHITAEDGAFIRNSREN